MFLVSVFFVHVLSVISLEEVPVLCWSQIRRGPKIVSVFLYVDGTRFFHCSLLTCNSLAAVEVKPKNRENYCFVIKAYKIVAVFFKTRFVNQCLSWMFENKSTMKDLFLYNLFASGKKFTSVKRNTKFMANVFCYSVITQPCLIMFLQSFRIPLQSKHFSIKVGGWDELTKV